MPRVEAFHQRMSFLKWNTPDYCLMKINTSLYASKTYQLPASQPACLPSTTKPQNLRHTSYHTTKQQRQQSLNITARTLPRHRHPTQFAGARGRTIRLDIADRKTQWTDSVGRNSPSRCLGRPLRELSLQ